MNKLRNILKTLGLWVLVLLLTPLILFGLLLYILSSPIQMVRYYRSPYYKGTKRKYKLFAREGWSVRIYDRLIKNGRSFQYDYRKDFDYFVLDGHVLLAGLTGWELREHEGEWFLEFLEEHEEYGGHEIPMLQWLEEKRRELREEHRALPVKLLVVRDDLEENEEEYTLYRQCPYMAFYESVEEM